MREILLLSKRLIKAKEFERIALTNNINFEDLKDGYVKLYNSQDDYIDIYLDSRDEKGKPYVNLSEKAEKIVKEKGITKIHISLSDTDKLAMAYVVAEGD